MDEKSLNDFENKEFSEHQEIDSFKITTVNNDQQKLIQPKLNLAVNNQQQLRTSARVTKKIKLDLNYPNKDIANKDDTKLNEEQDFSQLPTNPQNVQGNVNQSSCTNQTNSITRKNSGGSSSSTSNSTSNSQTLQNSISNTGSGGVNDLTVNGKNLIKGCNKTKSIPMSWTHEDKNYFFDALKEYGRDFVAIQQYIANKNKKRTLNGIKSTKQIRSFYLKSWINLSKFVIFSSEVRKIAQQLYTLINYGELRRRVTIVTDKFYGKLSELIYRGYTQVKGKKGKMIRITTPPCPALRKLNKINESPSCLKLPSKVMVELRPKDMKSWTHVQSMGQNPRVQCQLSLHKRLSTLVQLMESRWRTCDQYMHERLLNSFLNETNPIQTTTNVQQSNESNGMVLIVAPKQNSKIQVAKITNVQNQPKYSLSLNAYEERNNIKNRSEQLYLNSFKAKTKDSKLLSNDDLLNKDSEFLKSEIDLAGNRQSLMQEPNSFDENKRKRTNETAFDNEVENEPIEMMINSDLKRSNSFSKKKKIDEQQELDDMDDCEKEKEKLLETFKKGWSAKQCENMTIGELYLMIGIDSKIELEYWWQDNLNTQDTNEMIQLNKLSGETVSKTLQQLLSLARMFYSKERIECPCGHVCKASHNKVKQETQKKPFSQKADLAKSNNKLMNGIEIKPEAKIVTNNMTNSATTTINDNRQFIQDGVFRRPILPRPDSALPSKRHMDALKAQLSLLQPRFCNRNRNRNIRTKQPVIQRLLLPKTTTLTAANTSNASCLDLVMQMTTSKLKNHQETSSFVPIAPKTSIMENNKTNNHMTTIFHHHDIQTQEQQKLLNIAQTMLISQQNNTNEMLLRVNDELLLNNNNENCDRVSCDSGIEKESSGVPSPSISEISFSEILNLDDDDITTSHIRNCSPSSENSLSALNKIKEFLANTNDSLISSNVAEELLKQSSEEDQQNWLSSEIADFSFSSFLGHLESSPLKSVNNDPISSSSNSQIPKDVDEHIEQLMSESSFDYTSKFADLASQVAKN